MRFLSTIVTILTCFGIVLLLPAFTMPAHSTENAIARLNYAGFSSRGHCTAVLISKNAVLTAGHCVDKWPMNDLRLVFGYAKGEWTELRKIRKIRRHKNRDLAILCLIKPSKQKPIEVGSGTIAHKPRLVTIIGYPRSRPHLARKKQCQLQQGKKRARLTCPLEPGMSGAPVIVRQNGKRRVVGIASRTSRAYSIIERVDKSSLSGCR